MWSAQRKCLQTCSRAARPNAIAPSAFSNKVLSNATKAEGSLAAFFWRYEAPAKPEGAPLVVQASSAESTALSKALKKRGWSFVGPTTVYAFMQSVGMVNDHDPGCHHHGPCEHARRVFKRPA